MVTQQGSGLMCLFADMHTEGRKEDPPAAQVRIFLGNASASLKLHLMLILTEQCDSYFTGI